MGRCVKTILKLLYSRGLERHAGPVRPKEQAQKVTHRPMFRAFVELNLLRLNALLWSDERLHPSVARDQGLPCQAAWHNFGSMRNAISSHYARIGRRGGQVSTPAKRAAARRNALKRWGHGPKQAALPVEALRDGRWYRGQGRNATVGLWDARARCFWTIAVNDFADPAKFPAEPLRRVRLKREDYCSNAGGTFRPIGTL